MATTTSARTTSATTTDEAVVATTSQPVAAGSATSVEGFLGFDDIFVVQPGDTLKGIARALGCTVDELKASNRALLKTWSTDKGKVVGFDAGATIQVPHREPEPAPALTAPDLGESAQERPPAPAAPSLAERFAGLLGQARDALGAMFGTVTGTDGREVAPEDVALDECPLEEEGGEGGAAAPGGDAAVEIKAMNQNEWYYGDGKPVDKTVSDGWEKTLGSLMSWSTKSDAYSNHLTLPTSARPESVSWWADNATHTETVSADIQAIPQIAFIPGGASCQRASRAMANATTGTDIMGGSGDKFSHIQVVLASDQKAKVDEAGKARTINGRTAMEAKDTEEIEPERLAIIRANVALACSYMDEQLAAGHAIVIGVSYTTRDGNRDKTTDHWMCVHAKSGDGYLFVDPAGGVPGTLAVNADKGGVMEGRTADRVYELAQVQFNKPGDAPSDEALADAWKQKAGTANAELSKGTAEEGGTGGLHWNG